MDADTVKDLGAPIAMAVAMGYYIWRMTQFLLTSLTGSLAENRDILIKLIDAINAIKSDQTNRICELEQRVAEIREQHRSIHGLLVSNSDRSGLYESRRDKGS